MSFYGISIHTYSLDFSHMVFRGIQTYSYIDLKEDSIKGECCETTPIREQASTDEHASLHE